MRIQTMIQFQVQCFGASFPDTENSKNPMCQKMVFAILLQRTILQQMQDNNLGLVQRYSLRIAEIVTQHNYKRIVLQIPKQLLPLSFKLAHALRNAHPQCQFYVLYDSLKQSCCTDLLGAEHVGYDCLIHFGKACFSSQYKQNQHFIFQQPDPSSVESFVEYLTSPDVLGQLEQKQIRFVVVDQKYYQPLKSKVLLNETFQKHKIQMLRLPMDTTPQDQYLAFGYHISNSHNKEGNFLIIEDNEHKSEAEEMTLCQRWSFIVKSLPLKTDQIFFLNLNNKKVEPFSGNHNKRLMQRYSMISQLDDHNVFGIIVSNTATTFHQKALLRCQDILKRHNKKAFTFLMNNLNEVKLGNFPEIQVYVIISCFNHSLFSVKDFHRLVVTPNDLQVAFQAKPFDQYDFDCQNTKDVPPPQKIKEANNQNLQLDKVHTQIVLANKIQTLDHYRDRQFKGLEFAEKKEVKKASKGKIGLAQQYKNLQ